jgi:Protein of unknown function (DUF2934)
MKVRTTRLRKSAPRRVEMDDHLKSARPPRDDVPSRRAAADPTPGDIARGAYELYERRGRDHGRDWKDWLQAERELRLPVGRAAS